MTGGTDRPVSPVNHSSAGVPSYVVNVSVPDAPRRWTNVILIPLELLAVAWTTPFVILAVGIPLAFALSLLDGIGRFLVSYFFPAAS